MIELQNLSVTLSSRGVSTEVFENFSAELPSRERLVILGPDGVGKTTLVRLIAGLLLPREGRIIRRSRVSFPVGFSAGLKRKASALENVKHVARLYGTDMAEIVSFVKSATRFDMEWELPVEELSPQARLRLCYAIGYGASFDTYLLDDRIAAGDIEFRKLCEEFFWERMKSSGCILVTKTPALARRIATKIAILEKSSLRFYANIDEALSDFRISCARSAVTNLAEG